MIELDLDRSRDLRGRGHEPWGRRALICLLAVPVVLAAIGVFGQRVVTHERDAAFGRLHVELPSVVRGGLLWRAKVRVDAREAIASPRLVLGSGFVHGMQLNTVEPGPAGEISRGDAVSLRYPALNRGDSLVVYLQLQVDATTIGDQDTSVTLTDGDQPITRLAHTTHVLP